MYGKVIWQIIRPETPVSSLTNTYNRISHT
jgi:hypothetical protein